MLGLAQSIVVFLGSHCSPATVSFNLPPNQPCLIFWSQVRPHSYWEGSDLELNKDEVVKRQGKRCLQTTIKGSLQISLETKTHLLEMIKDLKEQMIIILK